LSLEGFTEGPCEIGLYDLNGRLVRSLYKGAIEEASALSVDLGNQASGMYIIRLTGMEGVYSSPVIIHQD
jgi:hypothetical protein